MRETDYVGRRSGKPNLARTLALDSAHMVTLWSANNRSVPIFAVSTAVPTGSSVGAFEKPATAWVGVPDTPVPSRKRKVVTSVDDGAQITNIVVARGGRSAMSGFATFVMVLQAADVGNLNDRAAGRRLSSPWNRRVLVQGEVRTPLVIISQETSERSSKRPHSTR